MALVERTGRPFAVVCSELGLSAGELGDREATFAKSTMDAAWGAALSISGDPGFGLSLSEQLAPGMLGPVEYLLRSMATLGEGYAQAVRYQNLLQRNTSTWRIVQTGTHTRYRYALVPPVASAYRHIVEFACATFVRVGRLSAARHWAPQRVRFEHGRGAPIARYEAAFECEVEFDADATEVVLDADALRTPMSAEDAHLAAIVREYAERRQRALGSETSANSVRRTLCEIMHLGDISLATVAGRLGTSERTLRRRLAAEGQSFQALVDEVRFDVTKAYLQRDDLSTEEIAVLVGFSDVSAFYRAFRRWYGANLSEFRQSPSK